MPDFQGGLVFEHGLFHREVRWDYRAAPHPIHTRKPGAGWLRCAYRRHHLRHSVHFSAEERLQQFAVIGIDPTTGTQKFTVPVPIDYFGMGTHHCGRRLCLRTIQYSENRAVGNLPPAPAARQQQWSVRGYPGLRLDLLFG